MEHRRFVLAAVLGTAAVLLAGNSIQAQGYFIGYYYPESKEWKAPRLSTGLNDNHKTHGPMWNPVLQRSSTAPMMMAAPVMTPNGTTSTSMRIPLPGPANVRVIVPEAEAVVWFGGHQTKSTGIERHYQSPVLQPGSYNYTVKVSFSRGAQQMVMERTVAVTPGQNVVVDFSIATAGDAR